MSDVIKFPEREKAPDLLLGPLTTYDVIVEGRRIPLLSGHKQDSGDITLIVDRRFMVDFPSSIAPQAAWLLANAIAVAQGYSHLGAPNKDIPFAPLVSMIDLGDLA